MASDTRSSRERRVPYQIPTEVLGQVYRHVERPADFGAVNSAFRGVHKDAHFERARKKQLIVDAIRRNNGRVFYEYPPGLSPKDDDLILNESGCVIIIYHDSRFHQTLGVRYGESIKRIEFKAIIGIRSMGDFRFVPVGRFSLSKFSVSNAPLDMKHVRVNDPLIPGWYLAQLQQNTPVLKTDLLRAIRSELEDHSKTVENQKWFVPEYLSRNYIRSFQAFLGELPSLEQDNKTVMDVIETFFIYYPVPDFAKGNAKIVDDTLEVSLCFLLVFKFAEDWRSIANY